MRPGNVTARTAHLSENFELVAETDISKNDVLCGRGPLSFNHEGNVRYRQLIANSYELHCNAKNKHDRACVVHDVTRQILSEGRFLREAKIVPKSWIVMTEQECLEKVSQAMRDAFKHSKGKSTDTNPSSRTDRSASRSPNRLLSVDVQMQNTSPKVRGVAVQQRSAVSFREDARQRGNQYSFQQDSIAPPIVDRIVSAASYPTYPIAGDDGYDIRRYASVSISEIDRLALPDSQSTLWKQNDMLTSDLDNTTANWGSHPSHVDEGRITNTLPRSAIEMDSKNASIDPKLLLQQQQQQQYQHQQQQQYQHQQQQQYQHQPQQHQQQQQQQEEVSPTQESCIEQEVDSFDVAINAALGPLDPEDFENAFKID